MPGHCAFISYSHSDSRFAAWLQRNLENFRIPPTTMRILDRDSDRLGPVFRDVADLGAATRLSDALTDALAHSSALIIICSSQSAESKWVALELAEFRRLHGEDALVLPIVSPTAGTGEADTMFPEALGWSPPLAADARRSADNRRIALLKLVAGLLGTGLDDLIQRDTRRRHAKLMWGISLTTALAVVMAILAVFAFSAREDAKRRLSQSEDLIGFMLGDLRAQLTPLGQIRVLESVGAKALTYFESLDDKDLTEAAMLRKSRALYQIGEVYFELGEFNAAHESFRLSLDQARQLAAEQPDNIDRLFEWSQAEFWTGFAAWYSGDFDRAREHLDFYHEAAWALHELEPENADWIMETFWASNNLGSLDYSLSNFGQALAHFQDAMKRINLLIGQEATPDRLYEKAAVLSWLGSTYFRLGELNSSKNFFLRALDQPLDMGNAQHREERSYFYRKLAEVEICLGEMEQARSHVTAALEIATALSDSDTSSKDLLYARTTHALQLAFLNLYEGRPVNYEELERAVETLLSSEEPPHKWTALAFKVADIGIRSAQPDSLVRGKKTLHQERNEDANWDRVRKEQLNLALSLAKIDESFVAVVEELLPGIEAKYHVSLDFDLMLPLMRGYKLLGRQAEFSAIRDAYMQSNSLHPDFLRLEALN
jgi:tetratricopeptide (TPR) repeat protein